MRLIDADAFREKVESLPIMDGPITAVLHAYYFACLDKMPTIEAVPRAEYEEMEQKYIDLHNHFNDWEPVVRCKDCKHFKSETENTGVCDGGFCHTPVHVAVIDFCSYGERRE